jgi:hypothetical protein
MNLVELITFNHPQTFPVTFKVLPGKRRRRLAFGVADFGAGEVVTTEIDVVFLSSGNVVTTLKFRMSTTTEASGTHRGILNTPQGGGLCIYSAPRFDGVLVPVGDSGNVIAVSGTVAAVPFEVGEIDCDTVELRGRLETTGTTIEGGFCIISC